ncbi:hypothetical protein NWP21_17870 [Anabaenopsis sp. FSS-46]|uniref:hypothetical protein n=1 Tax=Anabaenopsis sp. FSS-46 TaxID=2971766 RepID=UPI002474091C|nr:hypothetical protein [Anabaenopsis sp. FSS-46]MDH6100669.1 hypothetical protein [Anabaenopsis sp. FSS-46]
MDKKNPGLRQEVRDILIEWKTRKYFGSLVKGDGRFGSFSSHNRNHCHDAMTLTN